jgi:uncharacterized membrane protein (DUF485 family)
VCNISNINVIKSLKMNRTTNNKRRKKNFYYILLLLLFIQSYFHYICFIGFTIIYVSLSINLNRHNFPFGKQNNADRERKIEGRRGKGIERRKENFKRISFLFFFLLLLFVIFYIPLYILYYVCKYV